MGLKTRIKNESYREPRLHETRTPEQQRAEQEQLRETFPTSPQRVSAGAKKLTEAGRGVGPSLEISPASSSAIAAGLGPRNSTRPLSEVRTELNALHAEGKWSEFIAAHESGARENPSLRTDQVLHEKLIVALNKSGEFGKSLSEVRAYLEQHAPEGVPRVNIRELDPLSPEIRERFDVNGEILAGAGKAFRELSLKELTAEETQLIREYAEVPPGTKVSEGELHRLALELSTRFYEAGFFVDRSHYPGINAAHNNYRLGNLARAERFVWMSQVPTKPTEHSNADYWWAATQLEAAILTRANSDVPALFRAAVGKIENNWEPETTARTLEGTLDAMRLSTGASREETHLGDLVVRSLWEAKENPQLARDQAWVDGVVSRIEAAAGGGNAAKAEHAAAPFPAQFARLSTRIFENTVDIDWRHRSTDVDVLYREAATANAELRRLVESTAAETAGTPMYPPAQPGNPGGLKGRERASERIEDFAGDASQLTDIARASISFRNLNSLYEALRRIDSEAEIVSIKDRFQNPYASGYRDVLLKVRGTNGHVVELQLHLQSVIEVKNGPGHALYEQQRDFWTLSEKENRPLSAEENRQIDRLNAEMRTLYDQAYESSLGSGN